MVEQLKLWARKLKRDIAALSPALKDPDVPLAAKLVVGLVVAYALSPIDLIPDFIPIVGYLDDLLILPLGIALAIRLVGSKKMAALRASAANPVDKAIGIWGAIFVAVLWIAGLSAAVWLIFRHRAG